MYKNFKVGGVIVAAGRGSRMGKPYNKQYLVIENKPMLAHTLLVFNCLNIIDNIVVVTGKDEIKNCRENVIERYNIKKVLNIISGGQNRQQSVMNGLKLLKGLCDIVIIHDGARPFVTEDIILKSVEEAEKYGSSACAVPVKDTIKIADSDKFIIDTPQRACLYAVQTPQTFMFDVLYEAHLKAEREGFLGTDDTVLVERTDRRVKIFEGSYENIKITTPEDVYIAEAILKHKKGRNNSMRIGTGYDVHRLAEGRKLIIGGVEIEYKKGLLGHSDADVLLHAIMDALLGAAALGDIGKHFPDNDDKYIGISSIKLLKYVGELLDKNNYAINNIDATIIAQMPKMAPHIQNMRANIASALGVNMDIISIKATTEEGLGFTGRGEGISSSAIASVISK